MQLVAPEQVDQHFFKDASPRERFRKSVFDRVPRWYSPWAHLSGTLGVGVATLGLACAFISNLRTIELLTIPVTFVLSNLGEWHAHRNLLHRRFKLAAELYDRHTPEHHRVFRYGDMAIREWRELRLVLIPAFGVLALVLVNAPIAWLIGRAIGPNVGWLFLLTASLYVVSYEVTHLCYHLPEDSFVGRRAFVRWMREHHARHHDPRLMQRWNFNVTVPLGDYLFRTVAPKALIDEISRTAARRST